jgi:hypothetical protein
MLAGHIAGGPDHSCERGSDGLVTVGVAHASVGAVTLVARSRPQTLMQAGRGLPICTAVFRSRRK